MISTQTATGTARSDWRIPSIDGLRAVAMLMVFSCHMYAFTQNPTLFVSLWGHHYDLFRVFPQFPAGVDLFMVLSGFCLFLPACKSEKAMQQWHWQDFYKRRMRRIVPPYYAAIAFAIILPYVLVLLFHLLHQPAKWPPLEPAGVYIAHLLFAQTLFLSTFGHINAALWSMGLEAQFYLVFPLVIWGFRRFGLRLVAGMVILSIIYRIVESAVTAPMGYHPQYLASIFFLGRWMQFALGMAAAWIVARHRQKDQWRSAGWGTSVAVGSFLLFCLTCATQADLAWTRSLLLAFAFAGLIVALCISRTPLRWLFENRYMTWLGYTSYSIFLLHWPIGYYLGELFKKLLHVSGRNEFFLLITVGFGIVVAISYVFFLVFEKPFLKASAKRSPGAAVASHSEPIQEAAVP